MAHSPSHIPKTIRNTSFMMATDKAAGTDDLLRNILLELQSLNRNLERRPSGAVNSLDPPVESPEGALALPESPVSTGNHSSQSQQAEKSFSAPTQEAAGEQIPPTTGENEERPVLWTKDVLPFEYVQEGDILGLFETHYCAYHWLLSPHDWLNEDDYAKPSTEVSERWCRLYSKWGVPSDGRLQLSFETDELMGMHRADPEKALQHLDQLDVLENSLGRNRCSFHIHDHILVEDKEVGHVVLFTGRPEIFFKPKTIPQTIREQNIRPWNRVM
ncbi:hypothetical protein HYFRA_00012427 [Hymenoscyphus fraxineus]|uniref:Uncharacterized protein n=1 Tax=Hymenoscyphus fraxineus TaxID=746836 RepID=A0A9N9PYU2_9HELO|nr:hypothetical protein HYFRA_00012427 [Hymenoscyphus fraxineus]